MQEKVEIITNHIVHIWKILDKNTQKRICTVIYTVHLAEKKYANVFVLCMMRQKIFLV